MVRSVSGQAGVTAEVVNGGVYRQQALLSKDHASLKEAGVACVRHVVGVSLRRSPAEFTVCFVIAGADGSSGWQHHYGCIKKNNHIQAICLK